MNGLTLHYQREAERAARRQAIRYQREFWSRKAQDHDGATRALLAIASEGFAA